MVSKVISGGQTGSDQGGLRAAYEHGIATGGWAPKGFKTSVGYEPRLGTLYGLVEHKFGYTARTYTNVKESDGTIRLAINFNSPGEVTTLKAIEYYNKPHIDVDLLNPIDHQLVISWLITHNISILNVAGNSERFPQYNIFQLSFDYLWTVFSLM